MVVLVVLGLLAGLVGPRLFGRVDQSRVQTAQPQIKITRAPNEYSQTVTVPTARAGSGRSEVENGRIAQCSVILAYRGKQRAGRFHGLTERLSVRNRADAVATGVAHSRACVIRTRRSCCSKSMRPKQPSRNHRMTRCTFPCTRRSSRLADVWCTKSTTRRTVLTAPRRSCSTPSTSCGTSVCRTPSGQPPAVQIGNPADWASPPPRRPRATPTCPSHPIPRRVRPELQAPPPHHPELRPSNRPRAPCSSSCAHELDAAAQARLPHQHRTLCRVGWHAARHRMHRDARTHRENPHPSHHARGRRHPPPPRTSAPTPRLPISGPVLTAPAGASQPRCASPPVSFALHLLPDTRSCLPARYRLTSTAIRLLSHRHRTRPGCGVDADRRRNHRRSRHIGRCVDFVHEPRTQRYRAATAAGRNGRRKRRQRDRPVECRMDGDIVSRSPHHMSRAADGEGDVRCTCPPSTSDTVE